MNSIEQTQKHIMSTYGRSPVVLKQGNGAVCDLSIANDTVIVA